VVDPSLLVHGVTGLRVADASADACPVKGTGRGPLGTRL
jgi:choline dehydrogenase-like flavoprotein